MKYCLVFASMVITISPVSAHAERHIYVADHDVARFSKSRTTAPSCGKPRTITATMYKCSRMGISW